MSGDQRVFLVDGQAVYLEGGGDISEDVLQQALAQLTGRSATTTAETQQDAVLEVQEASGGAGDGEELTELAEDDDGEPGVLAVLQDETGQQQTVRLTPSQAAALGIDYDELLAAAGQEPMTEQEESEEQQLTAAGVTGLDPAKGTSSGDSKVTYTFEVVDDADQPQQQVAAASGGGGDDLLAKSRQIMVPQVRPAGVATVHRPAVTTATTVASTSAGQVRQVASGSTARNDGAGDTEDAGNEEMPSEDDPDVPVILTPMNGQMLPDFIEPRPGLKILVRPLREPAGAPPPPARPLGSSDNPIQLVQQGNTFKSLQPLSAEQLKQIATVLQQSRLNVPGNAKNTIYDANTNTRIVYRVVYPEDSSRPGGAGRGRGSSMYYTPRGRGTRGRPPGARGRGRGRGRGPGRPRKVDLDEDWHPGMDDEMETVRADPSEKKKVTTKTRTGRLSKPPKHMVKDYKHIHRKDLNMPDLDDSDGGYSDYGDVEATGDDGQDGEGAEGTDATNDGAETPQQPELITPKEEPVRLTAAGTPRVKRTVPQAVRDRFTCRTCGALCIGYQRLEGHYRRNPDHRRHELDPPLYKMKKPTTTGRPIGRPRKVHDTYRPPASATPAKRPRVQEPEEEEEPPTPEELLATLVRQTGGSVDRLCDTMAECVRRFRERVRDELIRPAEGEVLDGAATCTIDAGRAELTGLEEGIYLLKRPPTPPAPVATTSTSSMTTISLDGVTLNAQLEQPTAEPPDQMMEEPSAEDAVKEEEESVAGEEAAEDSGMMEDETVTAIAAAVQAGEDGGEDLVEVSEPQQAAEPVAEAVAEPARDALDEFVGGLVDTADYAPLPPAGEAAPAAAAAVVHFDAGQIEIRLPDGGELTAQVGGALTAQVGGALNAQVGGEQLTAPVMPETEAEVEEAMAAETEAVADDSVDAAVEGEAMAEDEAMATEADEIAETEADAVAEEDDAEAGASMPLLAEQR